MRVTERLIDDPTHYPMPPNRGLVVVEKNSFELTEFFSGKFAFVRHVSSPNITYNGEVVFEEISAGQVAYNESGVYKIGEHEQPCYHKLFFRFDYSSFSICKADHSLLHEFSRPEVIELPINLTHEHICKDDKYSIKLSFTSKNSFTTAYIIKGQKKDYSITTVFTRQTPDLDLTTAVTRNI
jgi:hypothetical protein